MNVAARDTDGRGCEWGRFVAAYLDGELEDAAAFESHAKECASCSSTLREQRRLLCLLDNAFDETFQKKVALPADFTRVVKARAQTDMSGILRVPRERTISLKICLGLACAIFVLLGAPALDALAPLGNAARAVASVLGLAAGAAADAGAGALVIGRAVGGRFVSDTGPHALFVLVPVFGLALVLLVLLIGRYHRARASD